jgi:hypothetical protein
LIVIGALLRRDCAVKSALQPGGGLDFKMVFMIAPYGATGLRGTGIMPKTLPLKAHSSEVPARPIGFLNLMLIATIVAIVACFVLAKFIPTEALIGLPP